jgi:hypothetical protein
MFELRSSCDDAGALLARRLDDPTFTRLVSRHRAEAEAIDSRRRYLVDHPGIGEGCLSVCETEPAAAAADDALGLVWFVSFAGDQRGLGRWSGPHDTEAEAEAEAKRLARLGYDPAVWSETDEQRAEKAEQERLALDRHQAKLLRIRAVHLGTRIGEGMAAHAITEGEPGTWQGFDALDCATVFDGGIKPGSDAWGVAERAARLAFDRAMSQHERPSESADDAATDDTPPDQTGAARRHGDR